MNQKSSFREVPQFVSRALTANSLRHPKKYRNATSRSKGRRENDAYRVREHLTEAEMDKLLATLKRNRHGHRAAGAAPERIAAMSEKISIQDVDGKPITGRYVLRDGIVIVTASDGRATRGAIEDSMLSPETLARTLLFQLHRQETPADDQ
jgi:hypothetical protein